MAAAGADAKLCGLHASRNRNQGDVVGVGPEEIAENGAKRALGQSHGVDDAAQVAGHEDDVPGLDRDIGAGADSDSDVGPGEGRGVVDAVADEGDPISAAL